DGIRDLIVTGVQTCALPIYSAKRFMGRRHEEVTEEVKRVPYKVVRGPHGEAVFEVRGKQVTPPEVSAKVLGKLKRAAEEYLGEKIGRASCREGGWSGAEGVW